MARHGKSLAKQAGVGRVKNICQWVGWVRKSRAVEDESAPIPEERTSELGGIILMVVQRAH
jgi:hypothetical protein